MKVTLRKQNRLLIQAMHQLRRKGEILSAILATLAFPLWWLVADEFCVSQPPVFLILICAGYGILAMTRPIIIVKMAGLFQLCYSFVFIVDSMFDLLSKTELPVLIIVIGSVLCLILLLLKSLSSNGID
jgi:hypothetical protein